MKLHDQNEREILIKELYKQPNPKSKLFNHFSITKPNEMHQIDLLTLPNDSGFMYALCLIDVASRFKAAVALRSKNGVNVLNGLKLIYFMNHDLGLSKPEIINSDKGSEFTNRLFAEYLNNEEIKHKVNEPSFHLSFVENMNKQLAVRLFKYMDDVELRTGKQSKKWVDQMKIEIDDMNDTESRSIGMKPRDAILLKSVEQPENNFTFDGMQMKYEKGTRVRR